MDSINFKAIIAIGALIAALLIVLVIVKAGSGSSGSTNSNSNNNNNNNAVVKEDGKYPEVSASAEEILAKIYSPGHDYFTGFDSDSYDKENIFGNKKQKSAASFSEKTRMSLALNTFKLSNMKRINCNSVVWDSKWANSVCGSNAGSVAYAISVQELNNRVEEIFNIRPDYSKLNIDDLTIGTCTGENTDNYIFRYIKDQSIYVSTKRNKKCEINGKVEVTKVSKKQAGNLLTLDVYYKSTPTTYLNRTPYYGESTNYQDQFFFKVKKDGSYYFDSSTLFQRAG